METLLALITLGVKFDSKAAFRCFELGEESVSSFPETFLLRTGSLGDWKIGVADESVVVRIPAGVVDLIALCKPKISKFAF